MSFVLLKNYSHYVIVNDDADFTVGSVHPLNDRQGPYRVRAHVGPADYADAGVVNALNDAVPVFLAHYERVQRWERLHRSYYKFTLFAILLVEQNEQGSWLAYRDDFPLLKKGHPARFASCKEAQRCAEAHEWDLYPGAKPIDDGLSWLPDPEIDWRSIPHLVEERANWQRSASGWLPGFSEVVQVACTTSERAAEGPLGRYQGGTIQHLNRTRVAPLPGRGQGVTFSWAAFAAREAGELTILSARRATMRE